MSTIGIPRDRLSRILETTDHSLRPGQIVQGKILSIYPNQKAKLQIGSQQMTAQLEAPLAVGERYHFQVSKSQKVIHLKVLGNHLKSDSTTQARDLLAELNLRDSRTNIQFVQSLIKENIPFTKEQLQEVLSLLESTHMTRKAQNVLKEMMIRHLPITSSVMNALVTTHSTSLANELQRLLAEVSMRTSKEDVELKLQSELTRLLARSTQSTFQSLLHANQNQLLALVQSLGLENSTNESDLIHLLQNRQSIQNISHALLIEASSHQGRLSDAELAKLERMLSNDLLPLLPRDMRQGMESLVNTNEKSLTKLVTSLQLFSNRLIYDDASELTHRRSQSLKRNFLSHVQHFTETIGLTHEHSAKRHLMNVPQNALRDLLMRFIEQKDNIRMAANEITQNWMDRFDSKNMNEPLLSEKDILLLKKDIFEKLLPQLPTEQRRAIISLMQNNTQSLEKMWTMLQSLTHRHTYETMENVLLQLDKGEHSLLKDNTRALLQSLQLPVDYLRSGSNESVQIMNHSIKALLIQMIHQTTDTQLSERARHMLHFINGLQLQSVNETSHFIQASLQIPAETIGLNGDLFMEFESQKTDDGQINPDFCRILFFLNLNQLKETIIDMHIQKRLISLTIYNDNDGVEQFSHSLTGPLKTGLKNSNYHLSTIRFKPLHESTQHEPANREPIWTSSEDRRGVDFRI